ncbi:MAG TPA: DUF4135 domain-containing protein [Rubrobacter sp.]|nr:DUF4135 domain-containing protein [Rubrobacter sp.]
MDERTAYHVSGLGEAAEQELPVRAPRWVRVNTDRMALEFAFAKLSARENVPRLDDAPLSLQEHSPQVVDGFRRMYRFLLDHLDALLGSDPLRELAHEQVRFVFRATRVYSLLLRNLQNRRYLRDGADRSIQLEQLGRAARAPSLDRGRRSRRHFVYRRAPCDKQGPRGALPYATRSSRRL